jgi:hypothetical protein
LLLYLFYVREVFLEGTFKGYFYSVQREENHFFDNLVMGRKQNKYMPVNS